MNALTLTPGSLTLKQLRHVWRQPVTLSLDESAHAAINDSVACVEAIIAEGRTAYGINTGFGLLAQTRIATHDLENLQRSLVLSHAAGVGQPLDDEIVRLRESIGKAMEAKMTNGTATVNDYLTELAKLDVARRNRASHDLQLLQAQYNRKYITNN